MNEPPLPRLTLRRLFVLGTLGIALVVAAAFMALLESSRQSILERSDRLRQQDAMTIADQIETELGVASRTLEELERAMQKGALDPASPDAVEARLFTEVLDNPTVLDATLTRATLDGYDPKGEAVVAPEGRWQVSVYRATPEADAPVVTRRIANTGGTWTNLLRSRPRDGGLLSAPLAPGPPATDPTQHPTFSVTAARENYGRAIWSELAYSEVDSSMPEPQRRVVVSLQKAIDDRPGHFAAVVRVGLLTRAIDALPRMQSGDGERVLLCDGEGRLVARLSPEDPIVSQNGHLRVAPAHVPPEVSAALAQPGRSGRLEVGGTRYLVTFHALTHSQEWMTAIIVPEDFYTRDLRALRDRLLLGLLFVTALVLAGGWILMSQVRGSLSHVVEATRRMRAFDFAAHPSQSRVREVAEVLDGVERAKTSLRALGKYVPVDLVRQLYASNREPAPGGELLTISIMFTDIEGFTSLAESLPPDVLAPALGLYLEAMTRGVRSTGGTVDKFIGDAVMAFWNAPAPVNDHATRACRAALACLKETRDLYASPSWEGRKPLFTRIGLHTDRVMVGHFGSPDRLSYTALGDGVNLAARLEGLCKAYGVNVLASEAIVKAAGDGLVFRRIDKVAVKGKKQSVVVYELLGEVGACDERLPTARAYEAALDRYLARDFRGALTGLEGQQDDGPSRTLAERCRHSIDDPPGEDWDGVYVAKTK